MRTVRRMLIPVVAVAMTMVAVPLHTSAASQVPFQATLTENGPSTAAPCPLSQTRYICVSFTGTGHATHLGAITETAVVRVDTSAGPGPGIPGCAPEVRTSTLTAVNGDSITLEGPGEACGDDISATAWDAPLAITGTGRFAGVVGQVGDSVAIHRSPPPVTSVTTFSGTLSSPGSLQ
jgi:hypothetical protein